MLRNEALATQKATLNLMNHMHSFHIKQSAEAKQERIERMRRARSMPKLDIEEVSIIYISVYYPEYTNLYSKALKYLFVEMFEKKFSRFSTVIA